MKKQFLNKCVIAIITAIMLTMPSTIVMAGQPNTGINGGQFTDWNTLTWTANDGNNFWKGTKV